MVGNQRSWSQLTLKTGVREETQPDEPTTSWTLNSDKTPQVLRIRAKLGSVWEDKGFSTLKTARVNQETVFAKDSL